MTEPDGLVPPTASIGDRAELIARAVIASVPVAGGAALELYNGAIQTPLQRRTQRWMENVADALRAHDVRFDTLEERQDFLSAMIEAGRVAIGTHSPEKLAALRNAVVNVALDGDLDADETSYFLTLVDQLTPGALRLLKFLSDPLGWAASNGINYTNRNMGGISHVINEARLGFPNGRETYDRIGRDLYGRGLTTVETFHTTMSGPDITASRTTPLGLRFLQFISEP